MTKTEALKIEWDIDKTLLTPESADTLKKVLALDVSRIVDKKIQELHGSPEA